MSKFYEKVALICGYILIHGEGVVSINKPLIINDHVSIAVKDNSGGIMVIEVGINDICKAHDYTLDNLIIRIMDDNHLIHV